MSETLKAVEGMATAVIGCYVAFIGTLQWYLAKEKLRLDLYNRRFEVYMQAMTFMQVYLQWAELDEAERAHKRIPFIRSVCESRFLFAGQPEILLLLEELYNRSFEEDGVSESGESGWILAFNSRLEELLLPFLAFGQRRAKLSHRPES